MKFNIFDIAKRHIMSLQNNRTGRIDWLDILLFYILPGTIGWCGVFFEIQYDRETYNASLTVYSIFAALLLSVQVAIFGIFQRGWQKPEDKKLMIMFEKEREARRELLCELNINISYLITICCLSVTYFMVMFSLKVCGVDSSGVATFLYVHFLLTLLMVIKRSYALFDKEYRKS